MEEQRIENGKMECLVCHNLTLDADSLFDICDVCNWQNDPAWQTDPNRRGGANSISLNEARELWNEGKLIP